jgi:hypothetical protein
MTSPVRPWLLAMMVLCAACALLRPKDPAEAVTGIYHARLPAADAAGRIVTLWLQPVGAAVLETVYVGKPGRAVERGSWSLRAMELTLVLFDDAGRPSTRLVYAVEADRLIPKTWDRVRYGDTGLPLARR